MKTALLLLALYLLLEPKPRPTTDQLVEPWPVRGEGWIEGGPSNESDWEQYPG